jgi:methionine synthase I (cobalamin-dependent)
LATGKLDRMDGTRQRLEAVLRERIAVLDGSWGVLIQ